jgi:hypothetical protein
MLLTESGDIMRRDDVDAGSGDAANGVAVPDSGTLVISTWHEHGAQAPGFRARITYGRASGGERTTVSTADADQVLRVVHEWLLTQTANGTAANNTSAQDGD